jgi:REP element-mobilizing transposase RayT
MAKTLSNVITHMVFSTKKRQHWLQKEICKELYPYTGKILQNHGCYVHQIGGMPDHIHIACTLSPTIAISKLVEEIKTSTSKWLKHKDAKLSNFYWQHGYGVFSISRTHLDALKFYITNQEAHHLKITFQDEFTTLLQKNNLAIDLRYLWD